MASGSTVHLRYSGSLLSVLSTDKDEQLFGLKFAVIIYGLLEYRSQFVTNLLGLHNDNSLSVGGESAE